MAGPPIIIIAETDPIIRNVLRVEFSQAEFAVLLAADGGEAEEFAARTKAHLVVLDVGLPHLSGYDACVRIRRRNEYRGTPIVLTARELLPRILAAVKEAGATVPLSKPYSFNDLLNALTPYLPADDPLLASRPKAYSLAERSGWEWRRPTTLVWQFGRGSALSRNGETLGIMRAAESKR